MSSQGAALIGYQPTARPNNHDEKNEPMQASFLQVLAIAIHLTVNTRRGNCLLFAGTSPGTCYFGR